MRKTVVIICQWKAIILNILAKENAIYSSHKNHIKHFRWLGTSNSTTLKKTSWENMSTSNPTRVLMLIRVPAASDFLLVHLWVNWVKEELLPSGTVLVMLCVLAKSAPL